MGSAAMNQGDEVLRLTGPREEEVDDLLDISSKPKSLFYITLAEPFQHPCFLLYEFNPPTAPALTSASQIQQSEQRSTSATQPYEAYLYELTNDGVERTLLNSAELSNKTKRICPKEQWKRLGTLRYRWNFEALIERAAIPLLKNNSGGSNKASDWISFCMQLLSDLSDPDTILTMFETDTNSTAPTPQPVRQDAGDTQHQEQSQPQISPL